MQTPATSSSFDVLKGVWGGWWFDSCLCCCCYHRHRHHDDHEHDHI